MIIQDKIMQDNRREQTKLAMALMDSMGWEGAVSACRANGWDGVLDVLLDTDSRNHPDSGPYPYHV